jgi:catechol 2,3-dioxygenase-like lactoylglutathione lyase family enzyme
MPKIQHIALSVDNPAKTAEYYKTVFGMRELNRRPAETGEDGVWLTDGYIYFAVLPRNRAGIPLAGDGTGVHHIGFRVENLDEACKAIEEAGATLAFDTTPTNRKYQDPDGICVDLRDSEKAWWDKRIGEATQLFELVPYEGEPLVAEREKNNS